jgi:hypothetical protein
MTLKYRLWALAAVCATAFANGAAAQELCGGAGANGQWIGGTEAASDIATTENYAEQMALVLAGNQHVALFSLSTAATVRIEAQARGTGDPLIDLLDSSGNIVLSDDDSGGNGAARAEVSLDPGTYCVKTSSYDSTPMTAFVRIGRSEQEPLTSGIPQTDGPSNPETMGSCATGTSLGTLGDPLSGEESVNNMPYWRFTLATPGPVTITAQNEDADPSITLYDANENYLTDNDDADGLNSRIDWSEILPAGDYCIEVNALTDSTLPIRVDVTAYDPAAALNIMYQNGDAAPPMNGSYPITSLGELTNKLIQDAQVTDKTSWYSLAVPQGGLLLVEAISVGGNGDPWLVVYDDLGRQVAQNDDYGSGYDSLVTARVNAGTYMVGVKQVSGGSNGFVRLSFERYVPAP